MPIFKLSKKFAVVMLCVFLTFLTVIIVKSGIAFLEEKRRFEELYGDAVWYDLAKGWKLDCGYVPVEYSNAWGGYTGEHRIHSLYDQPENQMEYLKVEGVSECYYSDPLGTGEQVLTRDIILSYEYPNNISVILQDPRVYQQIGKEWYYFPRVRRKEKILFDPGEVAYFSVSIYNFFQPDWEPEGTFIVKFGTYQSGVGSIYSPPVTLEAEIPLQN